MDSKTYTMMRLTGFLAGVGLTTVAFLLVLDTRESEQPAVVAQASGHTTAEELSGVVMAIAEQVDVPAAQIESEQTITSHPEFAIAEGETHSVVEVSGLDHARRLDAQAEVEADGSDRGDSGDAGTYLFWNPFRSEWAARGFAGRLTLATQIAVEVVNAGPGKYRVAFSYQDETERQARIDRIETITGLKLE